MESARKTAAKNIGMGTPAKAMNGGGVAPDRSWGGGETLTPLLTLEEVAEVLRLNPRTIRRLIAARRLPCVRLAGRIRFLPADVVRFVQARRG